MANRYFSCEKCKRDVPLLLQRKFFPGHARDTMSVCPQCLDELIKEKTRKAQEETKRRSEEAARHRAAMDEARKRMEEEEEAVRRNDRARERGFEDFFRGFRTAHDFQHHDSSLVVVPREHLPKLIRLCHPDKHGNSPMSNEMTVLLLELRGKK